MIAFLFALLLAQAGASPAPVAKPPVVVHIKMFAFTPATVRVKPGDTVEWINDDGDAHTVTSSTKAFDSGGIDTNDHWTHTFRTAGTFAYICALHPYMKGTVVVAAATP